MYIFAVISCILLRGSSTKTDDRQCTPGSTDKYCQPALEFSFFKNSRKQRPRPTKPSIRTPVSRKKFSPTKTLVTRNPFIRRTPIPVQNLMYVTPTVSNPTTTTQKMMSLLPPPPIPFELQVKQRPGASALYSQKFGTSKKLRQNTTPVEITDSLMGAKKTTTTIMPTSNTGQRTQTNVPHNLYEIQRQKSKVPHRLKSAQKKYSRSGAMKGIKTKIKPPNYKLNNSKPRRVKTKHEKRVNRGRKASKNRSGKRNIKRKKTRIQSNNERLISNKARKSSNMSRRRGYMRNKKKNVHATLSKLNNSGTRVKFNSKNPRKTKSTVSAIRENPTTGDIFSSLNSFKQVKGAHSKDVNSVSTTEIPPVLSTFAVVRIPKRMPSGSAGNAKMKKYEMTNKENKSITDDTQKYLNLALSEDSTKRTQNTPLQTTLTVTDNTVMSTTPHTRTPAETLSNQTASPTTTPSLSKVHHAKHSTFITQGKTTEMYKTQPASASLDDNYWQEILKTTLKQKTSAKVMDGNTQSTFPSASTTAAPVILSKLNGKQLQSVTRKITAASKQREIEADITTDISPTVVVPQERQTQMTVTQDAVLVIRQSTEIQPFYLQARITKSRKCKGAKNIEITQPMHKLTPDTKNPRAVNKHEVNRSWSVKVSPPQEDWTSSDNRASAVGIGSIGIIVILAIIAGVVCLDAATLYRDAKRIRKKIYRIFRPVDKRQCKEDASVSKNLPKWAHFVTTREA